MATAGNFADFEAGLPDYPRQQGERTSYDMPSCFVYIRRLHESEHRWQSRLLANTSRGCSHQLVMVHAAVRILEIAQVNMAAHR